MTVSVMAAVIAAPTAAVPDKAEEEHRPDEIDGFATVFGELPRGITMPIVPPQQFSPPPCVTVGASAEADALASTVTTGDVGEDAWAPILSDTAFAALLAGPAALNASGADLSLRPLDSPSPQSSTRSTANLFLARAGTEAVVTAPETVALPDLKAANSRIRDAQTAPLANAADRPLVPAAAILSVVVTPKSAEPGQETEADLAPATPVPPKSPPKRTIGESVQPEPFVAAKRIPDKTEPTASRTELGGIAPVVDPGQGAVHSSPDMPRADPSAGPATAQTLRRVAHQMAATITTTAGKPTEILLDPEELGRVRLSLEAGERSIAVLIQADRPETADLMRRHIDQLAQEFRSLGYQDVQFSFGKGQDRATPETLPHPHQDRISEESTGPILADSAPLPRAVPAGQLDLRL